MVFIPENSLKIVVGKNGDPFVSSSMCQLIIIINLSFPIK